MRAESAVGGMRMFDGLLGRAAPAAMFTVMAAYAGTALAEGHATTEFPEPSAALSAAFQSVSESWDAGPLAFSKVVFSDGPATGYGKYQPRSSSVFAPEEAIHVYAEPVGFTVEEADGIFSYRIAADFRLINATGQVLAQQDAFAAFSSEGRSARRELPATLAFQFSGLPAGDYALELDFEDEVGGKSATASLPFSISAAE